MLAIAAALLAAPAVADPVPVGSQFQVNTYTTGDQSRPSVAKAAAGAFMVVWQGVGSGGSDTSAASMHAQRFDSSGSPAGSELQVNTYTTGSQDEGAVAVAGDGTFVVAWTDYNAGQLLSQRFASDGSPVGGEMLASSVSAPETADVAVASAGNFMIAYSEYGDIRGQLVNAGGTPNGSDFLVTTYLTGGSDIAPDIAVGPGGEFVVVWQSSGGPGDTSGQGVFGRRFNSSGTGLGDEFQVNSHTTGYQGEPAVAVLPDGDFVVVFEEQSEIGGRFFDSSGSPVGSDFQVNTYTTSSQANPEVAAHPDDGVIVVWDSVGSTGTDTSGSSIQARAILGDGTLIGAEFQVNTFTPGAAFAPDIEIDANGQAAVVWVGVGSPGNDSDGRSIQVRRLGGTVPIELLRFGVE